MFKIHTFAPKSPLTDRSFKFVGMKTSFANFLRLKIIKKMWYLLFFTFLQLVSMWMMI